MKNRMSSSTIVLGAMLALIAAASQAVAQDRIMLKPDMIINESAFGDASLLVDEQDAIGDPASGKGIRPTKPFFPGWTAWQYPLHVVVDLGRPYVIAKVCLYNETGESPLIISTGTPKSWTDHAITLKGYRDWNTFPLTDPPTRYLRLTLTRPSSLPEIALYGTVVPGSARPLFRIMRAVPRMRPTFDQFVGTNAFIDDPIDLLAAPVGFVREYHNWSWDTEARDGQVRFQPSGAAGGNSWFFDDYYGKLKAHEVTVCPAIQNSSPTYFPGVEGDFKPVKKGDNPESPASYAIHAAHMYQYAARYGSAHLDESVVKLAADQAKKTGEGSLQYFENWNEPDKTWKGREGRFSPFELAAMCSADYDGDQGRMGKGFGVKSADPKAKMVLGGLSGIGLDYLNGMKLWADTFRGGDFPADVINLHHYSSDGTPEQPFRSTGISPEADKLKETMAALVAWRNRNVPKAEIWLSEFGYDTNPKSPFHAPAIGKFSAEEVQAIWLVRSYFALSAAGIDRAAMFMFRDTKSDDGGVFATSGMVTEKGQWKPKPSYYFIATLKNRLAGMRFVGEVDTLRKDVLIYRFTGPGKTAYALWRPTSEDGTSPAVAVGVDGKTATRVEFKMGSLTGVATPIAISSGAVKLDVREQPTLIIVDTP